MTRPFVIDLNPSRLLRALRSVVTALDWRTPRGRSQGEPRVTEDAPQRRRQAVARLEELTRPRSGAHEYDQDLVDAIMTDDGGRQKEGELNR